MDGIIAVAGPPAGGKTTTVQHWVQQGYTRLNRDDMGGSLGPNGLVYTTLRQKAAQGERRFVLDNLYASRESRAVLVGVAQEVGLPVHIVWLDTTPEQAQFFACLRQVRKYGRLFTEEDYRIHRDDPGAFPPGAQFGYWKSRTEPAEDEGFASITHVGVTIDLGPKYKNRAIILDYDGTLRVTRSGRIYPSEPDDVVLLEHRRELLHRKQAEGFRLLGASNQSGCSKQPGDPKYVSEIQARRCFDRTNQLLGLDIDYRFAPDAAGVPKTFWRKPSPGMGVLHIEKYLLDPKQCIMVGDRGEDKTFAARCGFQFIHADDFFR